MYSYNTRSIGTYHEYGVYHEDLNILYLELNLNMSVLCVPRNAYILKNILYISLHVLSIDTIPDRTLIFIYIYAIINIITFNRTSRNILIIVFNCVARIILGRVETLNEPTSILQILYNDRNCQIIYNNFITVQ